MMLCACPAGLARQPCASEQWKGWGPQGTFLLNFQKREYLIFVHFYKLVSVCALAFLCSAYDLSLGLCPPPCVLFHPIFLFPPPFHAACSPHTLCPPLPAAGWGCACQAMPAAWELRGPILWVQLAGPSHGTGHWAGILLEA